MTYRLLLIPACDEIAMVHNGTLDIVSVTAVDDNGRATIEGDLTEGSTAIENNNPIKLVYPDDLVLTAYPGGGTFYLEDSDTQSKVFSQDCTQTVTAEAARKIVVQASVRSLLIERVMRLAGTIPVSAIS